jgi:hypothetical protein
MRRIFFTYSQALKSILFNTNAGTSPLSTGLKISVFVVWFLGYRIGASGGT